MDDLIATADRQLASRSYEAAIDTYRTAAGEPGAAEAGIEEKLEAACRGRDTARGVVRPVAPPEPPPAPVAEVAPPIELPAEPRQEPEPEPEPAPAAAIDDRPVEPPAFYLIEDDPSMLERPRRDRYAEIDVRSILDPTPAPEESESTGTAVRILIAVAIAAAVVLVAYYAK